MLNVALVGSVARNALVGAVATKALDMLILSKLNSKIEQKKWLKANSLELFSKLSEEIMFFEDKRLEEKKRSIGRLCSKIILLSKNRHFNQDIEQYVSTLIKIKTHKEAEKINKNLIEILKKELHK